MYSRIVKKSLDNLLFLFLLQFFNYLSPFLISLILNRTLGEENFAIIALSNSLLAYLILFSDFGFNITSTNEIAKSNFNKIKRVVNKTLSLKFVLFCIITPLYCLVIFNVSKYQNFIPFLLFNIIILIAHIINPYFFYHGTQQLKRYVWGGIITKSLFFFTVIFLVDSIENILLYQFTSFVCLLLFGLYFLKDTLRKLELKKIHFEFDYQFLKKNLFIFLSRLSSMGISNIYTIFSSLFLPLNFVTYYYFLDKVISTLSKLLIPIQEAFYPEFSKKFNFKIFSYILALGIFTALIFVILITLFSKEISILLLGEVNETFIYSLKIMGLSLPFSITYMNLGANFLVVTNRLKHFNYSSYLGLIITFLILILIYFGKDADNIRTFSFFAISYTLTKILQFIYRIYILMRAKPWKNIS